VLVNEDDILTNMASEALNLQKEGEFMVTIEGRSGTMFRVPQNAHPGHINSSGN